MRFAETSLRLSRAPLVRRACAAVCAAWLMAASATVARADDVRLADIDRELDAIAPRLQNYPPQFASAEERSVLEAKLGALLDILNNLTGQNPDDPDLQLRKGMAYGMAHNLDVPDSAPRAVAAFDKATALRPDDAFTLYRYGGFLSGTTLYEQAIPVLQKAVALGEQRARYPLAFDFVKTGEPKKAIDELRAYLEAYPDNETAKKAIRLIEEGKLKVRAKEH